MFYYSNYYIYYSLSLIYYYLFNAFSLILLILSSYSFTFKFFNLIYSIISFILISSILISTYFFFITSSHPIRLLLSLSINSFITIHKSSEYLIGILSIFPDFIFIAKFKCEFASNGGRKAIISYIKHPKLHISLFSSYKLSFIYSGDI